MNTCPICENDIKDCQCENKVYLVVWAEQYDCSYVDSVWSSRCLAEKRIRFLNGLKRRKKKYFVTISEVKVDDYRLLREFGNDDLSYSYGLISF